jgi:phage protein D
MSSSIQPTQGYQGKFRRGTKFKLSFPTLPSLTVQPRRVDLVQKQYHHDILVAEFPTVSPLWFSVVKTGVPVEFNWTQNGLSKTWVGYVSFVSKEMSVATQQLMMVHCISASFPLKEKKTEVFYNKTIPEVASSIANQFGLNFIGENHSRRFDQLTITGKSYWEWLHEQAKRIGYAMVCDNTDLIFRPIDKLIDYSTSNIPVLDYSFPVTPTNTQYIDRTLDSIKVLSGEHIEGGEFSRTVKHVSGVDPISGKVYSSSQSPDSVGTNLRETASDVLFNEFISNEVAHSPVEVGAVTDGHANMSRFNTPAKIMCQGDPRMRPYSAVYVSGTGDSTDGHWIIQEVTHTFHIIGDYEAEVLAVTDGTGNNKITPARRDGINYIGKINPQGFTNNTVKTVHKPSIPKLTVKSPMLNQSTQGFKRTPAKWGK